MPLGRPRGIPGQAAARMPVLGTAARRVAARALGRPLFDDAGAARRPLDNVGRQAIRDNLWAGRDETHP